MGYNCRMPTITVRLGEQERAELVRSARVQGRTVSSVVREALGLSASRVDEVLAEHERRLARLEQMAGLS